METYLLHVFLTGQYVRVWALNCQHAIWKLIQFFGSDVAVEFIACSKTWAI